MHKNVEQILGRLATDPVLRDRFTERPEATLRELRLELTTTEIEALAATKPAAIRRFAASLDRRLRKALPLQDPTDPERNKENFR